MTTRIPEQLTPQTASGEAVWMEVIRKMDETYADLVGHQVELEKKNLDLAEAHAFIDDVMGAMTDVMIVFDPRGIVRQVNRALVQVVGGEASDFLDRPVAMLFEPHGAHQLEELHAQLRALGRLEDKSLTLSTPDGPFRAAGCPPWSPSAPRSGSG